MNVGLVQLIAPNRRAESTRIWPFGRPLRAGTCTFVKKTQFSRETYREVLQPREGFEVARIVLFFNPSKGLRGQKCTFYQWAASKIYFGYAQFSTPRALFS